MGVAMRTVCRQLENSPRSIRATRKKNHTAATLINTTPHFFDRGKLRNQFCAEAGLRSANP